jgi:thiol-disulfide isomerase/thioredoxin
MRKALRFMLALLLIMSAGLSVYGQQESADSAGQLLAKGKSLISEARFDEAIAALEEAVRLNPKSAPSFYQLGRAYANKCFAAFDQSIEDKSRSALKRAIAIDPSYSEAYYVLGRLDYFRKRYEAAFANYELAIKYDAALAKAYVEKWRAMLKREDFEAELPKIKTEIESLLKRNENRQSMLEAAAAGYNLLADENALKAVEDSLLKEFPKAPVSEEIMLGRAFEEKDRRKQADLAERFLARHAENEYAPQLYRILFLNRISLGDASDDELLRIGDAWIKAASGDGDSMSDSRAKVIIALAERGHALDRAIKLADETVKIFDEMTVDSKLLKRFRPDSRLQWIESKREIAHRARGLLLIKMGRAGEAEKELKAEFAPVIREVEKYGFILWKDMDLQELGSRPRVLWLAELRELQGNYEQAARFLLAGYNDNPAASRFIRERLSAVYRKLGRADDEAAKEIKKSQDRYRAMSEATATLTNEDREKAISRRLALPAPQFAVTRMNRKQVSLADFKGKVVALNFWATWCGPCVAEMPHLQKVIDKYKNDPDVVFLAISIDDNRAAVRPFLEKNGYKMTVAYDNDAARNLEVTGAPTTIIIDRNGLIQFKDVGFGDDGQLYVDRLIWRIDALLNEKANSRPTRQSR